MLRLCLLAGLCLLSVSAQCPNFITQSDACTCSPDLDGALISCSGNDGPAVVEKLKAFPMVIRELSIVNANIVEIGPRAFRNLQIKSLKLDHNKIARIDPDAFRGLETSLVSLSVSNNKLTEVPTDAITGMRALNILNLRCNNIGNIFGSVFRNVSSLIELNLGCNQICTIQGPAFDEVRDTLQSLILDQNCFKSIPGDSLRGFKALIGLHMEFNELVNVTDDDLREMESLLLLKLSGNQLRTFPNNASENVPFLRYLYLDQNIITNIEPNTFQNYKQLEILDLSYNQIAEIPANAFKSCEGIMQLKLQGNTIRDIGPNAFANTPLLLLLLNDNCLTNIGISMFQGIPFLRQLSLSGNAIRQIQPYSFTQLPNLHILDLASNRVEELVPNAVTASSHVTVLLQENPLSCTSAGYHIIQGGQPIHLLSEANLVCLSNNTALPALCPALRPRPPPPNCCTPYVFTTPPPTTTPQSAPALVYSTVLPPPRRAGGRLVNKINQASTAPVTPVPGVSSRTSINMERFWRLQNKANINEFRPSAGNALSLAEQARMANRIRRPVVKGQSDEQQFREQPQRRVEQTPETLRAFSPADYPDYGNTNDMPPALAGSPRVPIPAFQVPPTAVNQSDVIVDSSGRPIVSGFVPKPVQGVPARKVEVANEFVLNAGPSNNGNENAIVAPVVAGGVQFPSAVQRPQSVVVPPPTQPRDASPPQEAAEREEFRFPPRGLQPAREFAGIPPAPILPPAQNTAAQTPQGNLPVQSGSEEFFTFQEKPRTDRQHVLPGVGHNELNPMLMANGQLRPDAPSEIPERNIQNSPEDVREQEIGGEPNEEVDELKLAQEFGSFDELPPWIQERLRNEMARRRAAEAPPAKTEHPNPTSPTKSSSHNSPLKPFVAGSKNFVVELGPSSREEVRMRLRNRKEGEFSLDDLGQSLVSADADLHVGGEFKHV